MYLIFSNLLGNLGNSFRTFLVGCFAYCLAFQECLSDLVLRDMVPHCGIFIPPVSCVQLLLNLYSNI